ncbi:MAG: 7TM diverse intracellular signaling domain-containing protein [Cytophagales bacterium]
MAFSQPAINSSKFVVSYLIDSTFKLDIAQIQHLSLNSPPKSILNLGFCKYPCWLRIDVDSNQIESASLELKLTYPVLDSISYFAKHANGKWEEIKTGELANSNGNIADDRTFTFAIDSNQRTIFLKIVTQGAMFLPLKIVDSKQKDQNIFLNEKIYGAYFGALLVMICFNLAIFIILKDLQFFYYLLFIFFQACIHFIITGHHLVILPLKWHPHSNDLLLFSMYGTNIFAILFCIKFLDIKKYNFFFYRLLLMILVASVLVGILQLFVPYRITALLVALLYLLTPGSVLIAGIVAWHRGQKYARYFVFSWVVFVCSVILLSLRTLGLFNTTFPLESLVQIGSVIDVILLGIALAERYHSFELEKNNALKENLFFSKQIEENTREQNKVLESRILERTQELESTKIKVEQQNETLQLYNSNLEEKVEIRTEELRNLIQELRIHIVNFEQYSFIVSHNLRAPVARILGLVSIIDEETTHESNKVILQHLATSAFNLDLVVRDMNDILDIKNGKAAQYEYINFREMIEEYIFQNSATLKENSVELAYDFEESDSIFSVKFYLRSILYNLISNSIKYKNPDVYPIIKIKTLKTETGITFVLTDNGVGFDLAQYGDKIFGLYQRFNLEKEGRGIGLYMVKSQVEFLKGTIRLESTLGEGATFIINFPTNYTNTLQDSIH